jgi:hypothetical protein
MHSLILSVVIPGPAFELLRTELKQISLIFSFCITECLRQKANLVGENPAHPQDTLPVSLVATAVVHHVTSYNALLTTV